MSPLFIVIAIIMYTLYLAKYFATDYFTTLQYN